MTVTTPQNSSGPLRAVEAPIKPRPPVPRLHRVAVNRLFQFSVIVLVLGVWQAAATAGQLGVVPTPLVVAGAGLGLVLDGSLWGPLTETLASWVISLLLAVVIGVIVGFPLGLSRLAYRLSVVTLDFLRTIPALVFVPLVVLLYGAGLQSTILLAFFGAVWAMVMQTIYGARDLDPVARDTFRSYGVRRWDTVTRLLIPTALPYIATGIRLAAAICLLISISAQIVLPAGGIGEQIVINQLGGAVPQMFAYIVLCGALGMAIDATFRWFERSILAWHPSHRKVVS
jgi:ABC-type nitrate/sulfonate/bicarbonate transport system permease component